MLLSAPARPRLFAWWLLRSFHSCQPAAITIATDAAVLGGVGAAAPPSLPCRRCLLHASIRLANKTCPFIPHQQTRLPLPLMTSEHTSTRTAPGIYVPSEIVALSLFSRLASQAAHRSPDKGGTRCNSVSPWATTVPITRSRSGSCGPCPVPRTRMSVTWCVLQ